MANLDIYCTAIRYLSALEKLTSYIKPLGLGNADYPDHWFAEKAENNEPPPRTPTSTKVIFFPT